MKITSPANHPTVLEMYNNKREAADFREDVDVLTERLNDRFDDTVHEVIPPLFLSAAKDLMFYELLSAENRGKDELTTSYGHQRLGACRETPANVWREACLTGKVLPP